MRILLYFRWGLHHRPRRGRSRLAYLLRRNYMGGAQPCDLVFYPGDTHVGIVGGWDAEGNILIIHCASGYNNVVVTKQEGFTTIGRPLYYSE